MIRVTAGNALLLLLTIAFGATAVAQDKPPPDLDDEERIDGFPASMQHVAHARQRPPDESGRRLGHLLSVLRVVLAGIAARKLGITDPDYIDTIMLDHR